MLPWIISQKASRVINIFRMSFCIKMGEVALTRYDVLIILNDASFVSKQ